MGDLQYEGKKFLINDNFQSKKLKISQLCDIFENYQPIFLSDDQDFLSFNISDIHYLEIIPTFYRHLAGYDYDINPDPRSEENNSWTTNRTPDVVNGSTQISNLNLYPELNGKGLCISDGSASAKSFHYIKDLQSEITNISDTGIGIGYITVAVPNVFIKPARPSFLTDQASEYLSNYFKNTTTSLNGFVSFGINNPSYPDKHLRYIINFRNIFNPDTNKWTVYVAPSAVDAEANYSGKPFNPPVKPNREDFVSDSAYNTALNAYNKWHEVWDNAIPINDWDGSTFKDFKLEYNPDNEGDTIGSLYIKNPNENNWTLLSDNWTPYGVTFYETKVQFGTYDAAQQGSIIIKKYDYQIYVRENYSYKLDDTVYTNLNEFKDYCKELYSYNIGGDGLININWFFNNRYSTKTISDVSTINIDDSWFNADNINFVYNFQKNNKQIKISGAKNVITSFVNPSKNITSINLKKCPNLQILDVSNNLLTSLDLSNNILIQSINVSGNTNLYDLILPRGTSLSNLSFIDITNTKLNKFELIDSRTSVANKNAIELIFGDTAELIESLNIQGIKISNKSEFINNNFINLAYVNISETNILTNKNDLKTFIDNLPDRSDLTCGIIYMYGDKYTSDGIKGSSDAIADTLNNLKNKNWLFYL